MGFDVGETCGRNYYASFATGLVLTIDETSRVGFFPYGETWARRAPYLHDLRVGAWLASEPFQQVEYERFYGIKHLRCSCGHLPAV
jgi:hypothetical protein